MLIIVFIICLASKSTSFEGIIYQLVKNKISTRVALKQNLQLPIQWISNDLLNTEIVNNVFTFITSSNVKQGEKKKKSSLKWVKFACCLLKEFVVAACFPIFFSYKRTSKVQISDHHEELCLIIFLFCAAV